MIFLTILAWGCLLACWLWSELRLLTKITFTLLFLASFALLLGPGVAFLFPLAQCLLAIIIGGATFGLDWLMQPRWPWGPT